MKKEEEIIISSLNKRVAELESVVEKYQCAIKAITPWLSSSLTDKSCQEYHDACNACFEVDTQFKGIYDEM